MIGSYPVLVTCNAAEFRWPDVAEHI